MKNADSFTFRRLRQASLAALQRNPIQAISKNSDWLKRRNLKPKELVSLLKLSLEVGYDTVMNGFVPAATPPKITDTVQVDDVDLTAYDALCGTGKEVSA